MPLHATLGLLLLRLLLSRPLAFLACMLIALLLRLPHLFLLLALGLARLLLLLLPHLLLLLLPHLRLLLAGLALLHLLLALLRLSLLLSRVLLLLALVLLLPSRVALWWLLRLRLRSGWQRRAGTRAVVAPRLLARFNRQPLAHGRIARLKAILLLANRVLLLA